MKQKENWVELSEITEFVTDMNSEVKHLKLKKDLSIGNLHLVQDRFMVKFWITYPIRNNLSDTKVLTKKEFNQLSDEDRANNNYMIVSSNNIRLHISNYKTKKQYGIKTIKIVDTNVIRYMRDWLKCSPNPEYILINLKTNKPMTGNQITQTFRRIFEDKFDKNVSTTLLRHIVISHTFGKQIEDMDKMAEIMMHNKSTQQIIYNKTAAKDAADQSRVKENGKSMGAELLGRTLTKTVFHQQGLDWLKNSYLNASTADVMAFKKYMTALWQTRKAVEETQKNEAKYQTLLTKASLTACEGLSSTSTAGSVMEDIGNNVRAWNLQSQNDFSNMIG